MFSVENCVTQQITCIPEEIIFPLGAVVFAVTEFLQTLAPLVKPYYVCSLRWHAINHVLIDFGLEIML